MQHGEVIVFFSQIGAMLAVALLFGQLMRRLGQPAVLGELLGGVVLGPTVFGALSPSVWGWLFPATGSVSTARDAVLRIGMLFFLFVAGLEVNLSLLRKRGLSLGLTSLMGAVVPFGVGYAAARWWPGLWDLPAEANPRTFAVFVGTALSISALPVIARILVDLNLLRHQIGVIILSAATIDDLVGWSLFAVILGTMGNGNVAHSPATSLILVILFAGVVLILGRLLTGFLMRRQPALLSSPAGFIGMSAVLILAAAATSEAIGFHAVFGAFVVGVALGQGMSPDEEHQAHEIIHRFAVSFFAPLYFVSVGLKVNFASNFDPLLVLVVLVIACVGKIAGAGLGARLGGMPAREALAVGFGLNARGAMEIILATVALEYELIDRRLFVALVVMAVVTSLLSGVALRRLLVRPDVLPDEIRPGGPT